MLNPDVWGVWGQMSLEGETGTMKPLILCVHKQESGWANLLEILEVAGYDVLAATTGEQALRTLALKPVDGIILDHHLDAPGGVSLRNRIRQLYPDMPTLLFSHPDEIYAMPLHVFREYLETQSLPSMC